jgi:hypothetical protein
MVRLGEIRRKTAGGKTLLLKRKKNTMGSTPFRYEIETADGERVEPDAGVNVDDARREFERTVGIFRDQDMDSGSGSSSGGSMSSGGFTTSTFNVSDDLFGKSGKDDKFSVF